MGGRKKSEKDIERSARDKEHIFRVSRVDQSSYSEGETSAPTQSIEDRCRTMHKDDDDPIFHQTIFEMKSYNTK